MKKEEHHLRSYDEALSFLYKSIDYEKLISYQYNALAFNLGRMEQMLRYAGNPHKGLPCIHITGTKGKGSTAIMTATVLECAGFNTGLFTSPHLVNIRERVQINRQWISETEFVKVLDGLRPYIQHLREINPAASPTFFETLTAMGMVYFRAKNVDIAVLEVGLGGRLDSTNVVTPMVSVITNVGYDHASVLGDSISKIAYEKAGIIKQGIPVVSAVDEPEALGVIRAICREKSATLYLLGSDFFVENVHSICKDEVRGIKCTIRTWRSVYRDIVLPVLGTHQAKNVALIFGILEILQEHGGISINEQTIRDGFLQVCCPARVEVVGCDPLIVLDFAHTVESMRTLKAAVLENFSFERTILILGFSQDKDIDNILKEIVPFADVVIVTKSSSPRAVAPCELFRRIERLFGTKPKVCDTVRRALDIAKQSASPEDVICITGSVYVAGEAMEAVATPIPQERGSEITK